MMLFGLLWAILGTAQAHAVELPPFELDPVLSLTGNCSTSGFDPVPDPSCTGEPPNYPPAPDRPSRRFEEPRAIAIDSFGNEYVASWAESVDAAGHIDVFDDEGHFITEVAAPNAQSIAVDSEGFLYVFQDSGNVDRYKPSSYKPEDGDIAYEGSPATVSNGESFGALAVDTANDNLFVVRSGTITRYASGKEGNGALESFKPSGIGDWTEAIAVDAQRKRIYVSFCKGEVSECGVKVIGEDTPHTQLADIEGPSETAAFAALFGRLGIAVDEETGDFFVADIPPAKTIYRFDEDYVFLSQLKSNEFQANTSTQIAVSNGERSGTAEPCSYPDPGKVPDGDACNRHYLFVPDFKSSGRAIAFRPPAQTIPIIEAVSTAGIGENEGEISATIFPGGLDTTYHFEITTQTAWEADGWNGAMVLGEGVVPADKLSTLASAFATGLVAGETYRFRAVADNELGPALEEGQNEALFATYSDAPTASSTPCPNEALRTGSPSALLPDCRAYELVSPTDTNGRPPRGVGFVGSTFTTLQSSPAGDAVSFKIEGGSLPGSSGVGSFEGDPYLTKRTPSGWHTSLVGPTGAEATSAIPASNSPDQGYFFWSARIEGPLVIEGKETEYIRYPDGHSELIGRGSLGTDPRAQGILITEDASHILFETFKSGPIVPIQLEPDAPPNGTAAVYDRTIDPETGAEETHTVSLLPGNITPAAGQSADYQGASKDGEGIAFSIGSKLYLRVNNETTYEIGENLEFAGVSEGGRRVFYVEGDNLKAFDTASEQVIDFSTAGDVTPVNIADGGTRAYFVSPSVLGGTNPQGEEAQAGEQNLYLSEEGQISFVATVTDRDVEGAETSDSIRFDGLGLWTEAGDQIAKDPSRLNPDGSVFLFQSRAEITDYPASEFPQIYRYDATAGDLQCISCIPTGRPATGGAALESYTFDSLSPQPFSPNAFIPNQTPDGKRVFFESTEALVSGDTDEVRDVYEWEADEIGSCTQPAGCVYLISTGRSSRANFLYAHSNSGDDVFFTTGDSLTNSDTGGATSIYDAKVRGGFPEAVEEDECLGEACQPTPIGPSLQLAEPATKPVGRSGDISQPKTCPKGKRKVKQNSKVRCLKKHKKHKGKGGKAKQRAGANRGAGK